MMMMCRSIWIPVFARVVLMWEGRTWRTDKYWYKTKQESSWFMCPLTINSTVPGIVRRRWWGRSTSFPRVWGQPSSPTRRRWEAGPWVGSCEEEQGRPQKIKKGTRDCRAHVWPEELQEACEQEGVLEGVIAFLRIGLALDRADRGAHSHPRWWEIWFENDFLTGNRATLPGFVCFFSSRATNPLALFSVGRSKRVYGIPCALSSYCWSCCSSENLQAI